MPLIDFVVAEAHLLGDGLYIVLGPVILPLELLLELDKLLEVEAIAPFLAHLNQWLMDFLLWIKLAILDYILFPHGIVASLIGIVALTDTVLAIVRALIVTWSYFVIWLKNQLWVWASMSLHLVKILHSIGGVDLIIFDVVLFHLMLQLLCSYLGNILIGEWLSFDKFTVGVG